ncbi:molecular chaperone HtpG [Microbacterium sp. oral taxon 186 str. F0373]|uniref:HSP90 family protein n=1 Tax=Microbacterium sp. oral taxon 186 TaxID=712383 RepID=UPI00034E254A|nr:HSP90 family protein [Microbacterium sp. oral taxon 186]EPD84933.1 molecular chaperone HtpG [Microbacterium sp. oral taxon 186 str. F0373]
MTLNENAAAHQFQVDLRGVIDLLSRHIYSGPRVYLRELLQNAVDAISARRSIDGRGGRVRITPVSAASDEFVLRDDGVGLTAAEVADLLATVGRSSKRDIFDLPRGGYLGQFGIGMLSCFMVCDTIVIRSRSAVTGEAVEWMGHSDGTFRVGPCTQDIPVGTSVHLTPRSETRALVETATVRELAETFAAYLPVTIVVDLPAGGEMTITTEPPFLADDRDARLAYGRDLIGAEPLDAIALSVPATQTRGVAYVLPYAPPPSARQSTRVYLHRMLLTERADDILPDWAFFARAVIDSEGLHPTASRESLVDDDALEQTRRELGDGIRRWILELALHDPVRLAQFVAIHEVALKSLVRHDDELARFIVRWLSVETTQGRLRIEELVRRYPHVRYTETVDEFRQVASVADTSGVLVDGGYVYDADLVRLLPALFPEVTVERVDVVDEIDRLDLPPLDDRDAAVALERRAATALADVEVIVRVFERTELPGLFVSDPAVLRALDRGRARSAGGALWGGVLDRAAAVAGAGDRGAAPASRLCLNWNNDLVRRLAATPADAGDRVFALSVRLLYVQSLLAGHHPLGAADRALMTASLSELLGHALRAGNDEEQGES